MIQAGFLRISRRSAHQRRGDLPEFGQTLLRTARLRDRQRPQIGDAGVQRRMHGANHVVAATHEQHFVEIVGLAHDLGPVAGGEGPLQQGERAAQIFPMRRRCPLGEQLAGQPFEGGADFEDLTRLPQIQGGHDRALVRQALHQPFGFQMPQRFANRCPGDAGQLAEFTLHKPVARTKLIVDDCAPQNFQDLLTQCHGIARYAQRRLFHHGVHDYYPYVARSVARINRCYEFIQ